MPAVAAATPFGSEEQKSLEGQVKLRLVDSQILFTQRPRFECKWLWSKWSKMVRPGLYQELAECKVDLSVQYLVGLWPQFEGALLTVYCEKWSPALLAADRVNLDCFNFRKFENIQIIIAQCSWNSPSRIDTSFSWPRTVAQLRTAPAWKPRHLEVSKRFKSKQIRQIRV